MMTGADDDGGVIGLAEGFLDVGFGALEAKLGLHMIGAQGGLIDDRAEGNLVFEVRQEHGAGEVTRADDVDMGDGCGEFLRLRGE
jgi:hypothetical protein